MRAEAGHLARDWWCRGGGAAVLALMAAVAVFRRPDDPVFWAASAFLAAHTAMALRRWARARRSRTTATVVRHHDSPVGPFLPPVPLLPPRVNVRNLQQQTKKTA